MLAICCIFICFLAIASVVVCAAYRFTCQALAAANQLALLGFMALYFVLLLLIRTLDESHLVSAATGSLTKGTDFCLGAALDCSSNVSFFLCFI